MSSRAPFLDVRSFVVSEVTQPISERALEAPPVSAFLSLYEQEDGSFEAPAADQYAAFVSELHDEEFDQAFSTLVDEASAIYETHFEREDPVGASYSAERLLEQHFAPLVREGEALFETLGKQLSQRDPRTLTDTEIDSLVDTYEPTERLTPSFDNFFGALKKIAKKGMALAKKGVAAVAKFGLGKLKALVNPLLQRVIKFAIGKLPVALQPIARQLADKVPFLKELEDESGTDIVSEIQLEFAREVANVLCAKTEMEQNLEVARAATPKQTAETYPLAELDDARDEFVDGLQRLREGEDASPHVERFIPAILPALKLGINLIGRKKVVDFLANLVGKLIQKFIGPKYAALLSQAIVDAGLRLIHLEVTPEGEARAAAEAVAGTVEETVQRVAALPEFILDDQELFEGFAVQAFEQAAAANMPAVLSEETYRKRPDLAEARKLRGVWVQRPAGARKRYKKFSRKIPIKLAPHQVAELSTFEGLSLGEVLEDEFGIARGEEVDALVHLFEATASTRLPEVARLEEDTPGLSSEEGYLQLQPLTTDAAELLLGEPELGRDSESEYFDRYAPTPGQRFYYLEIPGKKPLGFASKHGRAKTRRTTGVKLILDFPKSEIRISFFLSEIRAQELAVQLRQQAHIGAVVARLGRIVDRGLRRSLSGGARQLKIVHEAVVPGSVANALERVPSVVVQVLRRRLEQWVLKGLAAHLKKNGEDFIKAANDTADGVSVVITLNNPPGFLQLRQALNGKGVSLSSLKLDGAPAVSVQFTPGRLA